ncbi:hypothetical protein PENTCL1PPCAC_28889, partial [Pristionchus entomophagus]
DRGNREKQRNGEAEKRYLEVCAERHRCNKQDLIEEIGERDDYETSLYIVSTAVRYFSAIGAHGHGEKERNE